MTRIGIMQRLREETRDCHDRLETRLGLPASVSTLSDYRALLGRFYGFYFSVECQLVMLLSSAHSREADLCGLNYDARRKVGLLENDLLALGLTSTELAALPQCQKTPALDTIPRALGCLYVLEGSTLGGQLLARHFAETLGINVTNGGAFFRSYGLEIGARWRAFGASLSAWSDASTADALDRNNNAAHNGQKIIVQAARETFHSMEIWLCSGD